MLTAAALLFTLQIEYPHRTVVVARHLTITQCGVRARRLARTHKHAEVVCTPEKGRP